MGIQSTQHISRSQAESLWVEKKTNDYQQEQLRVVKYVTNGNIEDFIESTFDNYIIKEDE